MPFKGAAGAWELWSSFKGGLDWCRFVILKQFGSAATHAAFQASMQARPQYLPLFDYMCSCTDRSDNKNKLISTATHKPFETADQTIL